MSDLVAYLIGLKPKGEDLGFQEAYHQLTTRKELPLLGCRQFCC